MNVKKLVTLLLAICMTIVYMPSIVFAEGFNSDSENSELNSIENAEDPGTIEDTGYDEETELSLKRIEELSDLGIDFSSKRLIVKGTKKELKDEPVIAHIDDIYLLQYDDYIDAIDAYYNLSEISDSVEFDSPMTIASSGVGIAAYGGDEVEPMTEEENPFTEIEEVKIKENEVYDIAVIDTGANDVDKAISVLGDDGKDKNGHGQKMIDTIKQYAPDAAILSIKAIGDDGIGDVSAVYAAIRLAIDNKVSIINLSISALSTEDNFIIEEIIAEAQSQGIIVVGAAGNNGMDAKLTVPGKIESATIVGTTNEASNTGDTVDYYVPVDSTSVAAATVTGLIISDTLKDYTVEDKVIKLNTEEDNTGNTTDPNKDFTTQDDSAGGSGGSGAGTGTGGSWSNTKTGRVYVWYDRGGFVGDGRAPVQGYYSRNGKWYDNTGSNPKTTQQSKSSNNWNSADSFYTYKFFIRQLTAKICDKQNKNYTYDFMKRGWLAGQNDTIVKNYMEEACQKALNRNPRAQTARVIGIAVTYRVGTFKVKSSTWSNIWVFMRAKGDKTYRGMFGGKDGKDRYPNTTTELVAPGWTQTVNPAYSTTYAGKPWYKYAYLTGKADNSGFSADTNKLGDRFFVVAVADNEPPDTVDVKIQKKWGANATSQASINSIVNNNSLYSLNGIVFKLYKSQANARADSGAVATLTTNASGTTDTVQISPGNYYLVELGPPKLGIVIPDSLKAANGGYLVEVSQDITITIGDTPLTGTYTASYQYTVEEGTLPAEVMATLPATTSHANGSIVTGVMPDPMEITIGNDKYSFVGWDAPKKAINSENVTFVGTWTVEDITESDDWEEEMDEDSMIIDYTYVLSNPADDDDKLPDEVWATLPEDLDDEGFPVVYVEGNEVEPVDPEPTTIAVENEEEGTITTYTWTGWDKTSATFVDTKVVFIGSWYKTVSASTDSGGN